MSNQTREKNRNNVFLFKLGKVNDFNHLRWSIYETKDNNKEDEFYLKSSYFGDYLCATFNSPDNLFISRGKINKLKIITAFDNSDNCKWSIQKVDSSNNKSIYFPIWEGGATP